MAPNPNKANQLVGSYAKSEHMPPKDGLQRTISDMTFELNQQGNEGIEDEGLASIWEVENAKCLCCGMSEECTVGYINGVRDRFWGKYICGLCGEAANEEMEKNGGKGEEALQKHINACVKFNRIGRSYPVLYQAEAIKEILKKSSRSRAKSVSPSDKVAQKKGAWDRQELKLCSSNHTRHHEQRRVLIN